MLGKVSSGNREDTPAHLLLFGPGALLSNAALFPLTQELRGRSPLLWEGSARLGDAW